MLFSLIYVCYLVLGLVDVDLVGLGLFGVMVFLILVRKNVLLFGLCVSNVLLFLKMILLFWDRSLVFEVVRFLVVNWID